MTETTETHWDKAIAVEEIAGVPFKMYTQRPRRIEHLLCFADTWKDRPYIVQSDRTVSFAAFRQASRAKAADLTTFGVTPGQRVFILGWNSPEWIINFWACIEVGAVPSLGNAWWSSEEIAHSLRTLEPTLVLADTDGFRKVPDTFRRARWETEELDHPAFASSAPDFATEDEHAPAAVIFTSGTAGRAKAVVLSHRSLIATQQMLLHVTRRLPFHPDPSFGEVTLHTGPLFHIGGIGALVRGVMLGNTLVFPRGRFDAGETIALIERHRISRWNAVPTMAARLLDHPDVKTRDVSSLKTMTLGGAPVHAELLKRIRETLPGLEARIATGYGLSENAGQATAAGGADVIAKPGSSGQPLPLVEVRIAPREGLPDGEVLVRSPTQMIGYFGEAHSPIDPQGWLQTGDLGRIDERGHLWITGRVKDLIIRGGENVSPATVERALLELPGVVDAAVIGVPHPELGEEVGAFVVVSGHENASDLQRRLRGTLASFAVPSRWWLQTEPLPVNQTGKVDKPALVARVREESVRIGTTTPA